MSLSYKFCVVDDLREEEFEESIEEMIIKYKWDEMAEKEEDEADKAMRMVLDDEENQEVDDELRMQEGMTRIVYNAEDRTWDYGRRRATDTKGNCQVTFPSRSKKVDEEAKLELSLIHI